MILENKVNLLIMREIMHDLLEDEEYRNWFNENYDYDKFHTRYIELGLEFLNDYALITTEKSD